MGVGKEMENVWNDNYLRLGDARVWSNSVEF